jgi:hypothetical protein
MARGGWFLSPRGRAADFTRRAARAWKGLRSLPIESETSLHFRGMFDVLEGEESKT